MAWAKANPNDPRSKQILEKLSKPGEPAPTSKPVEPAVATTPAEPVMTDAEKQAKAAKNREKNLSLPVDRPKPTAAPAAKDTEKGFPTRTVKPFTPPPVVKKEESIEDIERDIAKLKRENAATDKRIEKLKKQNASKSKVDD